MGSGVNRVMTGSLKLGGTAYNIRTVGFRPRKVEVINSDGLCKAEWNKSMPDAYMVKTVTDGTISYASANGITPLSDGFTIGADADINVDGEQVHWTAWE